MLINSSPYGQNGHHFTDNFFKCILMNEKFCILIWISIVSKGLIHNKPELDQVMAWHQTLTNANPVLWWIYGVLGGDELTRWGPDRVLLTEDQIQNRDLSQNIVSIKKNTHTTAGDTLWCLWVNELGGKLLPEPMMTCQLDPWKQASVKFESNHFFQEMQAID